MVNDTDFKMTKEDINSFFVKHIAKKKEKQLNLSKFINTIIFHKIISSIINNNIFLDSESLSYFPEKTLLLFNIPELTKEDLNIFISCLIDDELISPTNTFVEEENSFENKTSEKLGLKVFMMWGQGCCIQIFSAAINRQGE